jgi:hypothetical protein
MNKRTVAISIILVTFVSLGCSSDKNDLTSSQIAEITDEVLTASTQMREYSSLGDWESMKTFYSDSPNFRFYENGALQYASSEGLKTALSNFPSSTTIQTEYKNTEVRVLSSQFVQIGALYQSHYSDSSGASFEWSGALSATWTKEAIGWRILSGHSSAPVPRQ